MKIIKSNIFKYLLPLTILLTSNQIIAGETLSVEKAKSLIIGSTVYAVHLKKDFEFKVYFDVDGVTAHREQDGDTATTTYKFEDGKHCIYWKDKDRCANIIDNADGTYNRVNPKGKSFVKWNKVVKGNKL